MESEISKQLGEIAALLRQRIEVAEQAQRFAEERVHESEAQRARMLEQIGLPKFPRLDLPDPTEQMRRMEEQAEEERQERREFHARLLAAIERQNDLLEALLDRPKR
ncbi:MAG: hypothetical protein HY321_14870 [Armatimonadetes bacterium]|nr:hypothetical protein [Armatimonadota bacterium]